MRFSRRLDNLAPYLFAEMERKISEKRRSGVDVISLGIGDPDSLPLSFLRSVQKVEDALQMKEPAAF